MAGRSRICEYVSWNGRSTRPSIFRRQVPRFVSWFVIPMVPKSSNGVIFSWWVSRSAGFLSTRSFRGKSFGSIIFWTFARTRGIQENNGLRRRTAPVRNLIDVLRNFLLDIFCTSSFLNIMWESYFLLFFFVYRRRGSKDSRGQGLKGLFSKNFISAFSILFVFARSFLVYPIDLFQWNLDPQLIISSPSIRKQSLYAF